MEVRFDRASRQRTISDYAGGLGHSLYAGVAPFSLGWLRLAPSTASTARQAAWPLQAAMYAAVAPPSILASRLATPLVESKSLLPSRDNPPRPDVPFFFRPPDRGSSEDAVGEGEEDEMADDSPEKQSSAAAAPGSPRI